MELCKRLIVEEEGQGLVEYSLLIGAQFWRRKAASYCTTVGPVFGRSPAIPTPLHRASGRFIQSSPGCSSKTAAQ